MEQTLPASKSSPEENGGPGDEITVVVGTLETLGWLVRRTTFLGLDHSSDVVILPTGAAYVGATEATVATSAHIEPSGARVEGLMVTTRESAHEEYFAERVAAATWVVLTDGSPLHVRATLRETPVGDALARAPRIIAVGATATVLLDEMIDPRGGAPTTGLGYRHGVVLSGNVGGEQLMRTRNLLGETAPLIEVGPGNVLVGVGATWHQTGHKSVVAWLGRERYFLDTISSL